MHFTERSLIGAGFPFVDGRAAAFRAHYVFGIDSLSDKALLVAAIADDASSTLQDGYESQASAIGLLNQCRQSG
jgi:hypothetical protein